MPKNLAFLRQCTFALFLSFSLYTTTALAGTPPPLRLAAGGGDWLIAAQPGIVFSPYTGFIFHSQLTYGISDFININGRFGAGAQPYRLYGGGDVRFGIYRSASIRLDLYAGGHAGGFGAGFDAGAMISGWLGIVGLMAGLNLDFVVENNANAVPVNLVLGFDFAVARNLYFTVTGEINLNQSINGISGGLVFVL
ncbi:MAG: hypothetical protein RMI34_12535 [Chloroherpetonaceae bacterium]|nr:hypothetical protein [Chloroherpetonaceae bacterium]MDW8020884.1 hypothetical protein [Chloroherpetonaceae bacterium]